jgi:hypothetical protein
VTDSLAGDHKANLEWKSHGLARWQFDGVVTHDEFTKSPCEVVVNAVEKLLLAVAIVRGRD